MNFKETLKFLHDRFKELGILSANASEAFSELLRIVIQSRTIDLDSGLVIDEDYPKEE